VELFVRARPGPRGERQWLLFGYGTSLLVLGIWHKQPWPYFFVLLIPTAWVLIVSYLELALERARRFGRFALGCVVVLGIGWSLHRVPVVLARDNGFQRHMVRLAEDVLEPADTYFAGVEMIFTRRQPPMPLAWLDRVRLREVAGINSNVTIAQLQTAAPTVLIWNERLDALPEPVRLYLQEQYARWHGNIWVHSPTIQSGSSRFSLYLTGQCVVMASVPVETNGELLQPGDRVTLSRGRHSTSGRQPFRLLCTPLVTDPPDPRYASPQALFPNVYDY
jgi:hypothetical protein